VRCGVRFWFGFGTGLCLLGCAGGDGGVFDGLAVTPEDGDYLLHFTGSWSGDCPNTEVPEDVSVPVTVDKAAGEMSLGEPLNDFDCTLEGKAFECVYSDSEEFDLVETLGGEWTDDTVFDGTWALELNVCSSAISFSAELDG
jgi:hypothetical protein